MKQIYSRLKISAFKTELDRRRSEIIEEAVNKLKYNTTRAADTLVSLLSHSNPTIQRGVANDLLNHVAKFIEPHEIERGSSSYRIISEGLRKGKNRRHCHF